MTMKQEESEEYTMYAFVTGASSGIGKEIAILLAKQGYDLILIARREERLHFLKQNLQKKRNDISIIIESCDLSIPDNCIALFEKYKSYPITLVINNAGFGKVGYVTDLPLEDDLNMIRTNLTAVHIFTKLFAKSMKKGRILNIASMAAFQPGPYLATYSATKSYVFQFSMSINYELKRQQRDVHVTTLCPGPVNTEFNKVAGADFALTYISPKKCARCAIDALRRKKDFVVPSIPIKLLRLLVRITPYRIILPMEYFIQTKKLKK